MKKVLFFVITILMGFMLLTTSYQGFYMSHVQGIVEGALHSKDYDTLAKSFVPFFNKEEINYDCKEGKFDIISYEALVADPIKVQYNGKEVEANRYEKSFVFFIDDINFQVTPKQEGDKVNNYTNLTLYNGEQKYVYYFNDPIDATGPNAEGVKRFYTDAAKDLGFVMLSVPEKELKTLNGTVTKLEITNGIGDVVGSVDCSLDFESQFYSDVNQIIVEYDKYLKTPEDAEAKKAYQEFYDKWHKAYTENENYGLSYVKGEIKTTGVILKTVGTMSIYLLICVVLGYFILRKKPTLMEQKRACEPTTFRTTDFKTKKVSEFTPGKDVKVEKLEETKGENRLNSEEAKEELVDNVSKEENVENLGEESTKEN